MQDEHTKYKNMEYEHMKYEIQYPSHERGQPPILQLKSCFCDIYNSIKLFSNYIISISIES